MKQLVEQKDKEVRREAITQLKTDKSLRRETVNELLKNGTAAEQTERKVL